MTTTTTYPLSGPAAMLRRGDTFDYECGRTSHRLGIAAAILATMGASATFPDHAESCILHPDQTFNRLSGYTYSCEGDCPRRNAVAEWPAWVTGDVFADAYALADKMQTARGIHARRR